MSNYSEGWKIAFISCDYLIWGNKSGEYQVIYWISEALHWVAFQSSQVNTSPLFVNALCSSTLSLYYLLCTIWLTFIKAGWGYATDFGGSEESYYPEMGMTSYVRRRKMKRLQTFSRECSIFFMLTFVVVLRSFLVQWQSLFFLCVIYIDVFLNSPLFFITFTSFLLLHEPY